MSITLTAFLEQLETICATKPDYRIGGSGTDGTCDCIGLIIGALRRAGGSWKGYHGSNYAARKQMADFVELKPAHLFVGEIVFKARNPGDSSYSLPDRYKSGGVNCTGDLRTTTMWARSQECIRWRSPIAPPAWKEQHPP